MAKRGLAEAGAVPPMPTFEAALVLCEKIRDYLKCDPEDRRRNSAAGEALNKAMELFPLRVASVPQAGAEAHAGADGSANGTLDRLKMCASGECQRIFFRPFDAGHAALAPIHPLRQSRQDAHLSPTAQARSNSGGAFEKCKVAKERGRGPMSLTDGTSLTHRMACRSCRAVGPIPIEVPDGDESES
jgi:hypothetical protein